MSDPDYTTPGSDFIVNLLDYLVEEKMKSVLFPPMQKDIMFSDSLVKWHLIYPARQLNLQDRARIHLAWLQVIL